MPDKPYDKNAPAASPVWAIEHHETTATLRIGGDWRNERSERLPTAEQLTAALNSQTRALIVVSEGDLSSWGSALPALLYALQRELPGHNIRIDLRQLPGNLQALLKLAMEPSHTAWDSPAKPSVLDSIGLVVIRLAVALREALQTVTAFLVGLGGRARFRRRDLIEVLAQSGAQALPIITLVSLLVGSILAFVGAIQLQRFGAEIYIADLVGIAVAREMAAMMTAIVMAGRTGAAFAAHLATMRVNEEIDALKTLGLNPFDFLAVPRALALTLMLPMLYLYAAAISIAGGMIVAATLLDIAPLAYIERMLDSVALRHFYLGFTKSICFGALIGLVSCHIGLRAGQSAAAVGLAATQAVVISIVGVIIVDSLFAIASSLLRI